MALQAQMVTLQAKIDKPRHTGAENHQIQIEKWFNHPRKYGEAKDKDGDSKVCGIRDLAVKLQTIYTDNPDLAPGDNFTRLLDIYKKEVDSQTDNPITLQTAYMALKHRVFKWSKEDTDYLNYSISFESPNHLARWGMTREFLEQGDAANVLMPAPKPSSEPETTASANQRLLAEYEKREADTLEAMEESNNKIRKLFEEVLQENIAIIKAEYEGEEQKDKMAEEYMDNAKKLKQKLANNKREEDEHDLKEIRKAIAKLKK
jgi:hypothetical protein